MKKRLTMLLCVFLSLLLLTGCASRDIAKAKTAYANGDYQTVVDLLDNLKSNKPEVTELLNNAKVHLAFDKGDYQQVVDLIGNAEVNDEEIASMLEQAQAALAEQARIAEIKDAFAAEDFQKVVDLVNDEDVNDEEIASMLEQAQAALAEQARIAEIKDAFAAEDYQKVVDLVGDEDVNDEEIASMLKESQVQLAYESGDYSDVVSLLSDDNDKASNEMYMNALRNVARDAIFATGDDKYIQLPDDNSYLPEFKTMYVDHLDYDWYIFTVISDEDDAREQQRTCGPCIPVERVPKLRTGRLNMPWAYEGTKVTVLAEENDMSCILYMSSENVQRAGWVQTRFLVDEFPGTQITIGEAKHSDANFVRDIGVDWSRKGFLDSLQNYSVLSRTVNNCVGFTLDYQLTSENTDKWSCIFGPRSIYINDGSEWIKVGTFDYPTQGTVKVVVNLEEPTDIVAVGTIAEVGMPNTFFFRQYAYDFLVID